MLELPAVPAPLAFIGFLEDVRTPGADDWDDVVFGLTGLTGLTLGSVDPAAPISGVTRFPPPLRRSLLLLMRK